jgi:hypothetical protein
MEIKKVNNVGPLWPDATTWGGWRHAACMGQNTVVARSGGRGPIAPWVHTRAVVAHRAPVLVRSLLVTRTSRHGEVWWGSTWDERMMRRASLWKAGLTWGRCRRWAAERRAAQRCKLTTMTSRCRAGCGMTFAESVKSSASVEGGPRWWTDHSWKFSNKIWTWRVWREEQLSP